ncbi:hypothetical protein [Paucibacter sp. XJ19-41]|uniref:hypothetical protein n=1 Tax=Paucibacter sp. XJ19-41 TaxID=2927824 RepID=UPI00234BA204|nr:hypothetical protein [Paucibacter sp. XJ19-41]MDC6167875.1 hypothetical protein [Paucibacter sp. XJ19-41]
MRAGNVLANTASLALGTLGTLGLNSEDNVNAHAAELEGTVNATKAAFDAVTTKAGRQQIADKATGTLDKALAGDSGAISDVTEFAAGFVGGGAAVKQGANVASTAGSVVRQVERVAAREAMEGTATVAKAGVEVGEATVVKQTGRLTTEAVAGPGVEVAAGRTVKSVEAVAPTAVAKVDQPMFGSAGAASLTRRQYIEANLRESAAARESSSFGLAAAEARIGAAAKGASVGWNNGWRTADGKFASPLGGGSAGAAAEQSVWNAVAQKPGWRAIEGRVSVRNAAGDLRVYDGAAVSPRGRVIGLEVKSGGAPYGGSQAAFDSGVNTFNPAFGVGQNLGLEVGRSLLIRRP